jgi:hypothetical protein
MPSLRGAEICVVCGFIKKTKHHLQVHEADEHMKYISSDLEHTAF